MWFLFSSRVFLHLATLTIVWFLQYESYFFIFCVFSFLRQKSPKIDAKTRSQKNHGKMMVRASILGPRIDENRRREARKALKLRKHIGFGRNRFFIVFLMHFSMNFGSPGRPRGASKIDCSATFFDFFARLSLQSCSWGLLGPFRVNFSSIFG